MPSITVSLRLLVGGPVQFIVLEDGQAEFLDHSELRGAEQWTPLGRFVSLSINNLLSSILKKPLKVNYPLEREVSVDQHEICDLIDSEDFDFLRIVKDKGEMVGFEYQKSFSGKISEGELTDGYNNYEIKKNVVNGHVTSRTSAVRRKDQGAKTMILFSYLVWSTTALFEQDKPNDNLKGFVTPYGNNECSR